MAFKTSRNKSSERLQTSTHDFLETQDILKSSPISMHSNNKKKGLSSEALCQSIELLKMEITDVKERERSQESMYKKIIEALKDEIQNNGK